MKNKQERTAFITKKFGFTFRVYITGNNTAVKLLSHDRYNIPEPVLGTAVLHAPDTYNKEYGILVAMKAAINKTGSIMIGNMKTQVNSEISKFRGFNDTLVKHITDYPINRSTVFYFEDSKYESEK